jgi:hypothetical protein
MLNGERTNLSSVLETQLAQNAAYLVHDGPIALAESIADLAIGQPLGHQR